MQQEPPVSLAVEKFSRQLMYRIPATNGHSNWNRRTFLGWSAHCAWQVWTKM